MSEIKAITHHKRDFNRKEKSFMAEQNTFSTQLIAFNPRSKTAHGRAGNVGLGWADRTQGPTRGQRQHGFHPCHPTSGFASSCPPLGGLPLTGIPTLQVKATYTKALAWARRLGLPTTGGPSISANDKGAFWGKRFEKGDAENAH